MLRVTNLIGFGAAGRNPITIVDDGDTGTPSSGTTHTYTSKTSTGPSTIVVAYCRRDASGVNVSSITFNGNSCTILAQHTSAGSAGVNVAIAAVAGAQSGSVVVTYDQDVGDRAGITILSLANVQNLLTPVDTDTDNGTDGAASLAALSSPGAGGIRIAASSIDNSHTSTWSGVTAELADFVQGSTGMSCAYHLADSGATITDTYSASSEHAVVGVSIR